MEFPKIVEIVQVKSKQALDSHLVGNSTAAVEALQEVATLISSEFGATDEVAADSPEDDEKSEAAELADLLIVVDQIEELVSVVRGAVTSGHPEAASDSLLKLAELITKTLATESG